MRNSQTDRQAYRQITGQSDLQMIRLLGRANKQERKGMKKANRQMDYKINHYSDYK